MKITYENYGQVATIKTEQDDVNIESLGEILYNLCISQGWSKDTLKRIFKKEVYNG